MRLRQYQGGFTLWKVKILFCFLKKFRPSKRRGHARVNCRMTACRCVCENAGFTLRGKKEAPQKRATN